LIRAHHPAAADGRKCRDDGERDCHADQERQAAAPERLIRPCEHERQHRQDAGAQDREHTAEEREDEQHHAPLDRQAGTNFIARPFMQ